MPHGESWFNLLPFFHSVEEAAAGLPGPAGTEGKTWIAHETVHVQHVFGMALVLLLILIIGLIARAGLSDTKAALVPEDKLTTRTFVELFFVEGRTPEQIASEMRISVKTVYSKKHKIRCRLEHALARGMQAAAA